MDRGVRRRLRILAWFTFVVLVPLMISSARGYRLSSFSKRTRLGSPAIGALVIRTVPRAATAALDGRIVDQQTPTGIGSVPAGTHRVRIEKSGYRPYEKEIDIIGGRVTDLLHVRLLPQVVTESTLRVGVTDFWVSPDEHWVLLQTGARLRLVTRRAITESGESDTAERPTERQITVSVRRSDTLDVLWSSDSSGAAIIRRGENDIREVLGFLQTEGGTFQRPTQHLRPVGWISERGSQTFLALSSTEELLAVRDGRPETLASGVLAAAVHPAGVLIQQRTAQNPVIGIVNDRQVFTPLESQETTHFSHLAVSRRGNIAALSAEEKVLFVLPLAESSRWQRVGGRVDTLAWSPDGDTLVYQESPFDLWVLNVSEERSALPRGVPELLVRLSSPVQSVQWFMDSQHLLFLTRDVVEFLEVDPRDRRPADHLTSTNRGATRMAVLRDGEELWATARRENQDVLLQLQLSTGE